MRRILITVAGSLAALTSCALAPATPPTPGPPPRLQHIVADIPGIDDADVFAPWNQMAGYELFRNGPNPDVTIVALTPITIPGTTDRTPAGVLGKTIFYDPTMPEAAQTFVWQHELGHIIYGPTYHPDCPAEGVMTSCGFYTTRPGWFGPNDREDLQEHLD